VIQKSLRWTWKEMIRQNKAEAFSIKCSNIRIKVYSNNKINQFLKVKLVVWKGHAKCTFSEAWVRIFQSQQLHIAWDKLHIHYRKQLVELSSSLRHASCYVNRAYWVELLRGMWRHRLTSRITAPFRVCDLEVTGSSSWWIMCRNTPGFVYRVCTYYAETL